MKIYVTQGHENGIGIEIFLKAFFLLPESGRKKIYFVAYKKSILKTLQDNSLPSSLIKNLQILEPDTFQFSESLSSMLHGMKLCGPKDILITQPTTKDQLFYDGKNHLGHTEFFRYFYKDLNIPMSFYSTDTNLTLLSDHLPLSGVPALKLHDCYERLNHAINGFLKFGRSIEKVFIAGINPHAGEGGILGNEDKIINDLVKKISADFPTLKFRGPISGDALHLNQDPKSLLVYIYHDQGLCYFKSQNRLLGVNVTFGLPYLRLSVDHGTAFDLYGKNKADFSSMSYLFNSIFRK